MKTVWNGGDPFCGDALLPRPSSTGCRHERSTTRISISHRLAASHLNSLRVVSYHFSQRLDTLFDSPLSHQQLNLI